MIRKGEKLATTVKKTPNYQERSKAFAAQFPDIESMYRDSLMTKGLEATKPALSKDSSGDKQEEKSHGGQSASKNNCSIK